MRRRSSGWRAARSRCLMEKNFLRPIVVIVCPTRTSGATGLHCGFVSQGRRRGSPHCWGPEHAAGLLSKQRLASYRRQQATRYQACHAGSRGVFGLLLLSWRQRATAWFSCGWARWEFDSWCFREFEIRHRCRRSVARDPAWGYVHHS